MNEISPTTVLNCIADSLVLEGKFASKEDALRSLARAAVHERMVLCRRRIRRLEREHGTDFDGFTRSISGNATPQQEDAWLSWRSAVDTWKEWQAIYQSLAA